jgi:DNA-binding transcriptional MerR regulator
MNLKIGEVAKKLGVSVKTLQRWDNEGIFVALRNPKNQRYYTEEQLEEYLNKSQEPTETYELAELNDVVSDDISDENYTNLQNNKESDYYKNIGNGQIAYKEKDIEQLAKELNTTVSKIKKYSVSMDQYISWFNGGECLAIGDIEISKEQCIDFVLEHFELYINRINKTIENEKDLNDEINEIINEAVVPMAQDEINQRIRDLKKLSKEGKFEWK